MSQIYRINTINESFAFRTDNIVSITYNKNYDNFEDKAEVIIFHRYDEDELVLYLDDFSELDYDFKDLRDLYEQCVSTWEKNLSEIEKEPTDLTSDGGIAINAGSLRKFGDY